MSKYFEQKAIEWDNDPNRVQMARTIADTMIRILQPAGTETVMDYGTGTGLIALHIRQYVTRIVAVDSAQNMLAVLGQKLAEGGITSVEPRAWNIEMEAGDLPRFDIIVSSMTLHHVLNTGSAARVFYSLLKPNGRIAIADLDAEKGEFHEKPGIAEHDGFDREVLRQIFSNAGFHAIRFSETTTIAKRSSRTGKIRSFPIFLLTAARD